MGDEKGARKMEPYAITIARGFGTGGREIAGKLADILGIHSYENRILTLASQYSGRDEFDFVEVDERLRGSYLQQQLQQLQKRFTPKLEPKRFKADDRLFQFQARIIQELAKTESCIIVGKCADFVLKDYDNVLSVYIEAPRSFTLKRVMDRMAVSEDEANKLITKTDRYRAAYYKYYTGGNYWTNPVNYDLTLNNGRLGDEKCIELILDALRVKLGVTPKTRESANV